MTVQAGLWGALTSCLLDSRSGTLTGAWSMGRQLLSSYTGTLYDLTSGNVSSLNDQSGNARHLTQGTATNRPAPSTAGNQSRACADFDGNDNFLVGPAMSNFIANNNGYIVASAIVDGVTTNSGTSYLNTAIFCDSEVGTTGNYLGFHLRSSGAVYAFNWDGTEDIPSPTGFATGTALVARWMHTGGNVSGRINLGTAASTASGNTSDLTHPLTVGANTRTNIAVGRFGDMKIFEMMAFSTPPSDADKDAIEQGMLDWIS